MITKTLSDLNRRVVGGNIWFSRSPEDSSRLMSRPVNSITPEVFADEDAVGREMLLEIERLAQSKPGDLVITLLGGRGAQALHRQWGELAKTDKWNSIFSRLCIFTQDALAPMRMNNGFSFVRDFERLLGPEFFRRVKTFASMKTDANDLEHELIEYARKLESAGGIDLLFLGLGPEAEAASHLAYIKPNSGAIANDVVGMIPISPSILEHHIAKFIAGGTAVDEKDLAECRAATHILTLGPAAILTARRVVQSIVDASTAPGKRASYRRFRETELSPDPAQRAAQLDANPGLWLRLHANVRSLILEDVLES